MEEIAHTHLNHVPSGLSPVAEGCIVRRFDREQEDEAYGVGAAALLPWQVLFRAVNAGRAIAELAEENDVTEDLIQYRIKITGAWRVYAARQQKRA